MLLRDFRRSISGGFVGVAAAVAAAPRGVDGSSQVAHEVPRLQREDWRSRPSRHNMLLL